MRVLILKSTANAAVRDQYSVSMDVNFADRVIGHLCDRDNFCDACEDECTQCRSAYRLDYSQQIAGVVEFPATLPGIIEEPESFLPDRVPEHDVALAISVNEELLVAFVEKFSGASKGLVVPVESGSWISPSGTAQVRSACERAGTECSFPKPFCTFDPPHGVLKRFRDTFRVGKPSVGFAVRGGVISAAEVRVSAPCGATYFTARGLVGQRVDADLVSVADTRLSCYPCTADTAVDSEFRDSIMHHAVNTQRELLRAVPR